MHRRKRCVKCGKLFKYNESKQTKDLINYYHINCNDSLKQERTIETAKEEEGHITLPYFSPLILTNPPLLPQSCDIKELSDFESNINSYYERHKESNCGEDRRRDYGISTGGISRADR